ncbi:unnamed protein product, partial [Mycena citricolor]
QHGRIQSGGGGKGIWVSHRVRQGNDGCRHNKISTDKGNPLQHIIYRRRSTERYAGQTKRFFAIQSAEFLCRHARPRSFSPFRSLSVRSKTEATTPVLQRPPVRIWNPFTAASCSRCTCPNGFDLSSSRVNPMMGPGSSKNAAAAANDRCC